MCCIFCLLYLRVLELLLCIACWLHGWPFHCGLWRYSRRCVLLVMCFAQISDGYSGFIGDSGSELIGKARVLMRKLCGWKSWWIPGSILKNFNWRCSDSYEKTLCWSGNWGRAPSKKGSLDDASSFDECCLISMCPSCGSGSLELPETRGLP